jgi:hypothetical protein
MSDRELELSEDIETLRAEYTKQQVIMAALMNRIRDLESGESAPGFKLKDPQGGRK